jgi:hypothetical protein
MNKTNLLAVAFAVVATGCSAIAADERKSGNGMMDKGMMSHGMMGNMMNKMDANGDRMLSKDEFMKGHEQMFDRMKGQNGMIAMNEMPMNCMGMMGQGGMMDRGGMMGKDRQMPSHKGKETQ